MTSALALRSSTNLPVLVIAAGKRVACRFLESFARRIRNPHTHRAYRRAVANFLAWCEDNRAPSLANVQARHVAAWIGLQTTEHAAPTASLRLATLRHLFDRLVAGQAVPVNPTADSPYMTTRHADQ